MTFNIPELQKLIAKNRTGEVIATLVESSDQIEVPQLRLEVIQLSARWRNYRERSRTGVEDSAKLGVERRQIDSALLELLAELDTEKGSNPPRKSDPPKKINWKRFSITAGAIIAALAGIAEITGLNLMSFTSPKDIPQKKEITLDSLDSEKDTTTEAVPRDTTRSQPQKTVVPPNRSATQPANLETTKGEPEKVPQPKPDQLTIACKTNKDSQNPIFTSNETMRVYYKVNRPCLMRIIYKLADDRLVLFENDRQINQEEVGRFIELGDGYTASEPFGTESLYFFVQNEKFPELETTLTDDGYLLIQHDLKTSLSKTRGFKKKQYFAEYSIDLTTKQ